MAKKIKIRKSILLEGIQTTSIPSDAEIPETLQAMGDDELLSLWGNILDKTKVQTRKEAEKEQLENATKDHSIVGVNISKIDKIKVIKSDGTEDYIQPSRIAVSARAALADMMRNPETYTLAKYFPKDIIWTFDPAIRTAATDGVRIFMNPMFGDYLMGRSVEMFRAQAEKTGDKTSYMFTMLQYVIIHEVYHQLYQHARREKIKPETAGGKNHKLANIAQDVEINRAIESQLLRYQGCTEAIGGMWDERFKHEMWEDIFDAYYSGKVTPPMLPDDSNAGKNPQKQNGQQGQGGQGQGQQGQQGQSGQGQQGQQGQSGQGQGGQSGAGGNQQQKRSDSYKAGWKKALEDYNNGKIKLQSFISFDTANSGYDQAEFDQGYQDAINAIQAMYDAIKNGQNGQQLPNQGNSQNNQGGQGNGDEMSQNDQIDGSSLTPAESDSNMQFGGADVIDTATAQRIAAEAGQPYDSEDLKDSQNVEKKAGDFVKDHKAELEKMGKNRGTGHSFAEDYGTIEKLFQAKIDWRKMLKHFFNSVAEVGKDDTYSRKLLGTDNPDLQAGKYIKYKEKRYFEKSGVAQVFHLIDGSGSMGGANAPVFRQIFGEIMDMGKNAHIQKSAMAYFAAGRINKSQIRMWDIKANKAEVLKTLNRQPTDQGGGTDVTGSINNLLEMGKPYFSKNSPRTLLCVYTDGYDDYSGIHNLPRSVLNNSVWLIINNAPSDIAKIKKQLENEGIKASRVLGIDLNEYQE